jgi:transcriptional regulator with XRE-family HTH domain
VKRPPKTTFAERFEFARDRQRGLGTWQEDQIFARRVGVEPGSISGYKSRDEAPPAKRTLAIAQECEVDPGWLAFGEDSAAPAPVGFSDWLARKRTPKLRSRPAGQVDAEKRRGA